MAPAPHICAKIHFLKKLIRVTESIHVTTNSSAVFEFTAQLKLKDNILQMIWKNSNNNHQHCFRMIERFSSGLMFSVIRLQC
jgi:hypothetical protein